MLLAGWLAGKVTSSFPISFGKVIYRELLNMLLSLFWASLASAELLSLPFEKIIVDKPAGGRQIRDLTVPIENDVAHQVSLKLGSENGS